VTNVVGDIKRTLEEERGTEKEVALVKKILENKNV